MTIVIAQSKTLFAGADALPFVPSLLIAAAFGLLMSTAMMTPVALPAARFVALSGAPRRRARGPTLFVIGYLGTWTLAVLVIAASIALLSSVVGVLATVVLAAIVAGRLQFTAQKRRLLGRCRRTESIAVRGWAADYGCLRFGVRRGVDCVRTCAGVMLVTMVAGHSLIGMALVSWVVFHERTASVYRPRAGVAVIAALSGAAFLQIVLMGPVSGTPLVPRDQVVSWACLVP